MDILADPFRIFPGQLTHGDGRLPGRAIGQSRLCG